MTGINDRTSVELRARLWAAIDADIDNAMSMAAVDGDDVTVTTGSAIREAGWAQVPWVDGEWPPLDTTITITLTPDQWRFALDVVAQSQPSYERLGDHESLELGRSVMETVPPQLP